MPFPNNPTEAPVDVYPYIALTFLKGWPYKTSEDILNISWESQRATKSVDNSVQVFGSEGAMNENME